MKHILTIVLSAFVGFVAAFIVLKQRQPSPVQTAVQPEVLDAQPASGTPVAPERRSVRRATVDELPVASETSAVAKSRRTPQELLEELARINVASGPGRGRAQYRILSLLDELAGHGSAALPAIRAFLASEKDVSYGGGRNSGGSMLPPSLRMGLFDVVRQAGAESESILAESLSATPRVEELVYLSELLGEFQPAGKYTQATLDAAHKLLSGGKITDSSERTRLFALLIQHGDKSYVAIAQANLVQPDGKLDRSALTYLRTMMGEESISLAAQMLQDKRVADVDSREALGRLALNYVGANDSAVTLFHQVALDPQLKPDQRRNLIEDLNQDGLKNERNPTPEDLKIIAKRYELTQSYLQQQYVVNDRLLNAAFQEANRDLARMLQRANALPVVK